MAQVSIRMDEVLKGEAEALFGELGLSMTTAVNMFIKAAIRKNGIPFEVTIDPFYSRKNMAHLERSIAEYEAGLTEPIIKTMSELEAMANE